MKKPVLIIMAAGMGSRYGGLKQIDPVDEQGHIIMDFSLYDAVKAGFEKVIFILKRENEADFKEVIGDRISKVMQVEYVFQDTADLPAGFQMPEGRKKPWGTGHAVLSARKQVDGPFVVINADDYYGRSAFSQIYDYLTADRSGEAGKEGKYDYTMVGYVLENTLTETGMWQGASVRWMRTGIYRGLPRERALKNGERKRHIRKTRERPGIRFRRGALFP